MQKKWRIIQTKENTAAYNMALDEAIATLRAEGKVPNTLRFFTWKPSAITIGYFQSRDREVDLEKAKSHGIDVVRRYTGGGAVLHEDEITYSIVADEKDFPSDILASYKLICEGLISALRQVGITAEFRPINDIIVNGKKISGNAQTRKNGVLLQHGTLLLQVDVKKMFSILKVPDEKLRDKIIADVSKVVTSVSAELDKNISVEEMQEALIAGFQEVLNFTGKEGEFLPEEIELAQKLHDEKYNTQGWNGWR
ncbi:MAG: biotin/lipoate A/B protein ligase family protein [Candidatus Woesearchaeota archaeon]